MLQNTLSSLGFDENESRTYVSLLENGPHAAGSLAKKTGIVRVTQYVILKRLVEKGLIRQSLRDGKQLFTAAPPAVIEQLLDERAQKIDEERHAFQKLLPTLHAASSNDATLPKFEIFEGIEGVKNVLKDMLLYKDMETQSYWPIKKMIEVLSPEFFRTHNKERIRRNISVRAIWPKSEAVTPKALPFLGSGDDFLREIRIAPSQINFKMGYWIYGKKVAFLSSTVENFGYIIESAELVEMLLSQFEIIWSLSKPMKTDPKDVEAFVKELR